MGKQGVSRRNLFKYMAAGSAVAASAACQRKPEKVIPLLVPPDQFEYTPHASFQFMTTCRECSAGCGMMVTTREGRAQKAEGNPKHPLSQGALCARGQASMQALYHPDRIPTPYNHSGHTLSWKDAESQMARQLESSTGQIAYLGAPLDGSDRKFVGEWLKAVGAQDPIIFSSTSSQAQLKANELVFGKRQIPVYAFEKSHFLLSFGTDFMETWGSAVENSRRYAEGYAYQNGNKNKFVHIGPHVSLTGSNAEEWVSVEAGSEGLLALSLAYLIRKSRGGYPELERYLAQYSPERVAEKIGIPAEKIKELAYEALKHGPSLAIGGGNVLSSENATETLVAINVLNLVAGNIGKTIEFVGKESSDMDSHRQIETLIQQLQAGKIKTLIIDQTNPAYALPNSAKFVEALKQTFVIYLTPVKNETAHHANLVLPTLTPYETWGDSFPREGIHNIQQPVMAPVSGFDAKAKEEVFLSVVRQMEKPFFPEIQSYQDFLKQEWKALQEKSGSTHAFSLFWTSVLERGGLFLDAAPTQEVQLQSTVTKFPVRQARFEGDGELTLIPSNSVLMGDGSGANKPWLQEVPDPISQIVWDSWVDINPDTAKKFGIQDRSLVEITTPYGSVTTTAVYHFGVHRGAIAVPVGQGHTHSGSVADGFGVNVLDLLPFKMDQQSGQFAWMTVKASVKQVKETSFTASLDGNARQIGRNIAAAISLEDLQSGKSSYHAPHRPKEVTEFYPDRRETAGYYKPYRWGMVIDLDRCNGCSACVVACYAENNIPVVGKERAALGREMSWLRIERYIEGYGDSFEVRFSPMLCQQCGNAGCEPVCPVYATYHNPEGLNAQVYNRCVGTRYCSNNCAYKVRRFNWFSYEFPKPLDQQLNSTITTRSVGVMEKCTFCVQRIKEGQMAARELGRDLQDGEVTPACQQTCGSDAIVFGNLMDPKSKVSQMAKRDEPKRRDRQYEVLPELNYKPAITYLKKVRLSHSSEDSAHH